jgi:(E)-4-hydroxy-3-methylbut-2-enyl-diphosphate synthase
MVYLAGQQSHKLSNEQIVEHIVAQVETRAAILDAEAADSAVAES